MPRARAGSPCTASACACRASPSTSRTSSNGRIVALGPVVRAEVLARLRRGRRRHPPCYLARRTHRGSRLHDASPRTHDDRGPRRCRSPLAACGRETIEVSRGGEHADYNHGALLAAVDKFVQAGRTPDAYGDLSQAVLALRPGMDRAVGRGGRAEARGARARADPGGRAASRCRSRSTRSRSRCGRRCSRRRSRPTRSLVKRDHAVVRADAEARRDDDRVPAPAVRRPARRRLQADRARVPGRT